MCFTFPPGAEAMSTPVDVCTQRPHCGGATFCSNCAKVGAARADIKLLKSSVAKCRLPEIVHSVWPEATVAETVVVSNLLLKTGVAVSLKSNPLNVEHRFWPAIRALRDHASVSVDPERFFLQRGEDWALKQLTPKRCTDAGLHVFVQQGTSKYLVRRRTALNAIDKESLVRALRGNGECGTPVETIYKEYATAFDDIFALVSEGAVTIDEGMAWHSSNVPQATPGAMRAWRQALSIYKAEKQ